MKLNLQLNCDKNRKGQRHLRWTWMALTGITMLLTPLIGWSNSSVTCPVTVPITGPTSVDFNPSLPIGSIIGRAITTFPYMTTCDALGATSDPAYFTLKGEGGVIGPNLYPTGITGIAYRAKITAGWPGSVLTGYWPVELLWNVNGSNSDRWDPGTITFEFVKVGAINGSGATSFGPKVVGRMHYSGPSGSFDQFIFYLNTAINIKPDTPACTVTQSAILVSLEDTTTAQLTAMGNTSKDKAFNIPLNCTSSSNISLAFSGNVADTANAVFSNLSGSTNASTVGVQILRGSTPVPTTAGSYLNLGVVNGSTSVPFIARYYALVNNPDAGEVSAIAYATLVYN